MAPFRRLNKESQSEEAMKYCMKVDILADYTPLSELNPGFIKFKVAGVVTSIPHESSNFKKKMWSWLLIITDPSLEVLENEGQTIEVKEMKAHLFSNDVNAYPEVHRGDIVFMKQVQCEKSPFGMEKALDIRIFTQNDFTVVCCHSELDAEDSEPRPIGHRLLLHHIQLAKHLYNWAQRKQDSLPLIFSQLPSLNPPLIGDSKEYVPAPSTTFTNFPPVVSHGFKGIPRPYHFYLYVESVEEARELVTSSGETRKCYYALLTDGGIILPRDVEFAVLAGLETPEVVTKVELCISERVKQAYGIDLKPQCYYKATDVYISDSFNAVLLSADLFPALEITKKSKFEEIPRNHHLAVAIRERLEKLPEVVKDFKEKWNLNYKKVKEGETVSESWLVRTY